MELRDILGISVAVVIALLSQIVEPWSGPWWAGMIVSAMIAAVVAGHLSWRALAESGVTRKDMGPIILMALSAAGFCGGAVWYFWPNRHEETSIAGGDRWVWDALSSSELETLYGRLRDKGQYSFYIACNRPECSRLATSFDKLFRRLGWPSSIGEGGFLTSGVAGILINPGDDQGSKLLKEAVESTTVLRADLGPPRQFGVASPIMLILGTKPEIMPSGPAVAQISNDLGRWLPLSSDQIDGLRTKLANLEPRPVRIVCNGSDCRELEGSLAKAFGDPRWAISHRGGPFWGFSDGIYVGPEDDFSRALKTAIESATGLKVTVGGQSSQTEIFIGTKPF